MFVVLVYCPSAEADGAADEEEECEMKSTNVETFPMYLMAALVVDCLQSIDAISVNAILLNKSFSAQFHSHKSTFTILILTLSALHSLSGCSRDAAVATQLQHLLVDEHSGEVVCV